MFFLKARFEGVHFTHQLVKNRTLFFETGISDRQNTILNRKPWSVEEFGKTIVLSNHLNRGQRSMFSERYDCPAR
jgi:hypothetical protein